jgi:IS4 transposase
MRNGGRNAGARTTRRKLAENPGLIFEGILSREEVENQCRELDHRWRKRLFTPLVTLWTFLSQVLNADSSCRAAVSRVLGFLSATAGLDGSHDPSAYCRARKRLPLGLLPRLSRQVSEKLAAKVEPQDLWHGHRVKLVDGSTVSMPDSPQNQKAYPQPSGQRPGCGFPMARLVAIFDLITGAVVNLAMGALSVGETILLHGLWDSSLEAADVVVADRHYCSYADIALLQQRGVEAALRLHQGRRVDFRKGRCLGRGDRRVEWTKRKRPKWLSREHFDALPDTLTLRLVRFRCEVPGWRARTIVLVTTLLDPQLYPAADLAELFHRRWEVETDLRHLKTTMQMDVLRTRSPDMVQREVWAHVLAYNLIRSLMWEAAKRRQDVPLSLSVKGAIQEVMAQWPYSAAAHRPADLRRLYDRLLRGVGCHRVPHRPHRVEPRGRKRRPKHYPMLTKPRFEYKRELVEKRA